MAANKSVLHNNLRSTGSESFFKQFGKEWEIGINAIGKVSDSCASRYIASGVLKELEITGNDHLTGQCLANIISTNFTSLALQQCKALEFHHFLSNIDRLRELTKLKFIDVPNVMYENIHVLLGKMPRLEHLHIYVFPYGFRELIKNDHFFESVCSLGCLRHLGTDLAATGRDLEAVMRRCKKLNSLLLDTCEDVTSRGLAAACRYGGARLIRLGVAGSQHITDDDVVACVLACPNLTDLDIRFCSQPTEGLWSRVRAARRPLRARTALRLYVNGTRLQNIRDFEEHDGVVLDVAYSGLMFDR